MPDLTLTDQLEYFCFQLERCPETSRLHYQGVVKFSRGVSMAAVKKKLKVDHVHLEICRAPDASIAYCSKEESRVEGPWVGGDKGGQGARRDVEEAVTAIKQGASLKRIAEDHPLVVLKYAKGLDRLHGLLNEPEDRLDLKVYLLWGPTGTGKSRAVRTLCPVLYQVFDPRGPWFDGYGGEKDIVLEEMGPRIMTLDFVKTFLDVYKIRVPVKGGSVGIAATRIFVTSNFPLDEWFPGCGYENQQALLRRFTRIFHIKSWAEADAAVASIHGAAAPVPAVATVQVSPQVGARAVSPHPLSLPVDQVPFYDISDSEDGMDGVDQRQAEFLGN